MEITSPTLKSVCVWDDDNEYPEPPFFVNWCSAFLTHLFLLYAYVISIPRGGGVSSLGDQRLLEQEGNHERKGDDGKEGGDDDKLGRLDFIAAVFGGKKAETGSSRKGLNKSTNGDDDVWEV